MPAASNGLIPSTAKMSATSTTKPVTARVELTSIYDLHVQYDDGMHAIKCAAYNPVTNKAFEQKILATVDVNRMRQQRALDDESVARVDAPLIVSLPAPSGKNGGYSNSAYIVGAHALNHDTADFDAGPDRYTSTYALVRFYGSMSRVLDHFGMREANIHLTVGVNGMLIDAIGDEVIAKFSGQHYFMVSGVEYHITVRHVYMESQPWYAARALRKNPPERVQALLQQPQYTFARSSTLIIDAGGGTTDFALMVPENGKLVVSMTFAVSMGTHTIREEITRHIVNRYHFQPNPYQVEEAIHPLSPTYGTIMTQHGDVADISGRLAQIIDTTWNAIFTNGMSRLRNTRPLYVFVVGGMSIMAADSIRNTIIGYRDDGVTPILLGGKRGFAMRDSRQEFTVLDGMRIAGERDAYDRSQKAISTS